MIDRLADDGDFVQFNHPNRTLSINKNVMEHLSGYRLIEGDSGFGEYDKGAGSALTHWDEALSAGRYVHNNISDDNHNSKNLPRIARRCSWINTATPYYEDVKEQLLKGNFYTTRVPNFGNDSTAKHEGNMQLPKIKDIGLSGDTVYMRLSAPASSIRIISQNGTVVDSAFNTDRIRYAMATSDPYVRITAWYDEYTFCSGKRENNHLRNTSSAPPPYLSCEASPKMTPGYSFSFLINSRRSTPLPFP